MTFWFDMDGTIVDLYGVENWLFYLESGNPLPYKVAKPLVNMARLAKALNKAKRNGNEIAIVSWTAKNGTTDYNLAVENAKREWLKNHLPSVVWNEIKVVPYGTPKSTCGDGILFDDELRNRIEWGTTAHTPNEIFEVLRMA